MTEASSDWPWKVRAVQLDLARRMETVDFIQKFTDFAAQNGFNTLVLYLEGRVQTTSFPFRSPQDSYTPDEMAQVVAHATKLGIEVVPVISTLGHAEQFLECAQLHPLAEERGGDSRFGNPQAATFCPSQEETYEFLERYLSEIAEIFPSTNLHVGCDEAWNLGFCPLCREKWEKNGLGTLFFEHVKRVCAIARSLGKRPWVWDDFWEYFPEKLAELPRDVVLCHWNYEPVIEREGPTAHFANRERRDLLGEYRRLGFDVLACPWAISWLNVESLTDYARHQVWGGILTQWELRSEFYERYFPTLQATGKLWNSPQFDSQNAWCGQSNAARALSQSGLYVPQTDPLRYLRGPLSEGEQRRKMVVELALEALQNDALAPRELVLAAQREQIFWELRDLLPQIYNPRRLTADTARLEKRVAQLPPEMAPLWERLGRELVESDWWIVLRLFLPDVSGAPRLRISVGDKEVANGTFKPPTESAGSHYTLQIPFSSIDTPERVQLEVGGYGGQGVAWLEVQNRFHTWIPGQILVQHGSISGAEKLLIDDSHAAFLGHPEVAAAILNPTLAKEKAILKMALRHLGE